ncbi:LOW QUALITY PROTEIN: protein chibby homolog 2 [Podargus strigoides]
MSAFDLMNQRIQCVEPERECIVPRIKVRDEMFVFIDGKWVNETYCQPSFASHQKQFIKRAQNQWSILEENRALREENQVLQIENRMLWEKNKALQCLQSQNKVAQVIYTGVIQQSLQQENNPFPFFQERNIGLQVSPGNKALWVIQETPRVLEDFQQENKTVCITCKDQKAITVHEESKDASSDLQEDTAVITAVEEGNPVEEANPASQQEHKAEKKSTTPTEDEIKAEILQALRDLCELLRICLKGNHIFGEEQGGHIPYNVNRSFQEDYNKLKLQLNAVKNVVLDIIAQMEMLEKELIAITSPMYEEEGWKLATEYDLGEM